MKQREKGAILSPATCYSISWLYWAAVLGCSSFFSGGSLQEVLENETVLVYFRKFRFCTYVNVNPVMLVINNEKAFFQQQVVVAISNFR